MVEDMAKVLSMHMYTKVKPTAFGMRVECECGEVYGSGKDYEPPADTVARHLAENLARAGYGPEAEYCPYDCDSCHDPDCPCDRLGCAGSGVELDS